MNSKKFDTQFNKAEDSPGFVFWRVSNLHQWHQRQALKKLDLTPTQFSVLACYAYLADHLGTDVTQADVCKHSSMDKMHVSDITRALIKKKFLKKKKREQDLRSFGLSLTEEGIAASQASVRIIEKIDRDFFKCVSDPKNFLRDLQDLCHQNDKINFL